MTGLTYHAAVAFAVAYLERNNVETAREDNLKQLKFRLAVHTGYAFFDEDGNRAPPPIEEDERSTEELLRVLQAPTEGAKGRRFKFVFTGENTEAVGHLIERSRVSSIACEALLDVAASMARHGLPYHCEMGAWVSDYLGGKVVKTARTGRIKEENLWRDLLIVGVILELAELGLPATRNDVSPPTSACDVVAEAFREIGLAPRSYQSIKRIWNNSEQVLRFF